MPPTGTAACDARPGHREHLVDSRVDIEEPIASNIVTESRLAGHRFLECRERLRWILPQIRSAEARGVSCADRRRKRLAVRRSIVAHFPIGRPALAIADRKGKTRSLPVIAADLPTADERIGDLVHVAAEFHAAAERELIHAVDVDLLRRVVAETARFWLGFQVFWMKPLKRR